MSAFGQSAHANGRGVFEKAYPAQSKVASHTPFQTIPLSSASVRQALPAVNTPAKAIVKGKPVTIQGTVLRVISGGNADMVTISFAPNFRSQVAARVDHTNYSKLPDLNGLTGKHVLVSGKVSYYMGRWPQILVTGPSQIRIVQ